MPSTHFLEEINVSEALFFFLHWSKPTITRQHLVFEFHKKLFVRYSVRRQMIIRCFLSAPARHSVNGEHNTWARTTMIFNEVLHRIARLPTFMSTSKLIDDIDQLLYLFLLFLPDLKTAGSSLSSVLWGWRQCNAVP